MNYIRVELNVFEATLATNKRTVKWKKSMELLVRFVNRSWVQKARVYEEVRYKRTDGYTGK